MVDTPGPRGIRVRRLRLAAVTETAASYEVNLTTLGPVDTWRPLSIIAGPSQTGKTSIVEFVLYCLGATDHPQHPEVLSRVRSAFLECDFAGVVKTIERAAVGQPSRFASVWDGTLDAVASGTANEERQNIEPTSDPLGLSQSVLSACDLNGIELPEAPTQSDSRSQLLSVRDLFRIIWLPNERLDNKNLAFEHSQHMIAQKFRQVVDVIFEIDDQEAAKRAARIKSLSDAARVANERADSLKMLVQEEYPGGSLRLEMEKDAAESELARVLPQIESLDVEQMEQEQNSAGLRASLSRAQQAAREASLRVRNRESLLERLTSLRGQYADDKKKLTFLKEAERFFDPLHITVCPACMSKLTEAPAIEDGHCSMCGADVSFPGSSPASKEGSPDDVLPSHDDDTQVGSPVDPSDGTSRLLEAELRATNARLSDLNDYWSRLDADLRILRDQERSAREEVDQSERALTDTVALPAPYLATRDQLRRRATAAELQKQSAEAGLRLWARVEQMEAAADRLSRQLRELRAEHRSNTVARPDRTAVISRISRRFGEILAEFDYPKLSEPLIDSKLIPHVRGLPYTAASSGGRVLISLAYLLALWEVAHEEAPRAPGILIIDSPQKNLGHAASKEDVDFADAQLVENFYAHAKRWLAGRGRGAQLIVVDNSPPDSVADDVVVRYTRDRGAPPYGLIEDAID